MSEEIAWAAGLFEGEGCFSRAKSGNSVITILAMSDEDVVRRFARIVGRGKVRTVPPRKVGYKPSYRWEVSGYENMRHIYGLFKPWLGDRRRSRVEEILALQPAPYVRENVPPPCGKTRLLSGSGAIRHERLGELPCVDCARERAAYTRDLRRRRRKQSYVQACSCEVEGTDYEEAKVS